MSTGRHRFLDRRALFLSKYGGPGRFDIQNLPSETIQLSPIRPRDMIPLFNTNTVAMTAHVSWGCGNLFDQPVAPLSAPDSTANRVLDFIGMKTLERKADNRQPTAKGFFSPRENGRPAAQDSAHKPKCIQSNRQKSPWGNGSWRRPQSRIDSL